MRIAHNPGMEALMMSQDWRHAFTRIQIEYIEMPNLTLTLAQIRRLCDLTEELCDPAVAALEQAGFLWRGADGRFARRALGRAGREISAGDVDIEIALGARLRSRVEDASADEVTQN